MTINILKRLNDRRTKANRKSIYVIGFIISFVILVLLKFILLSIVFITFYFIIIFFGKDIKTLEIATSILILTFGFILTRMFGHISLLILFVITLLIYVNRFFITHEKNKIKLESMVIIALTIVLLEVSFPIVKPRMEILEVEDVDQGYIVNEQTYRPQIFTLSIQPPLISKSCNEIFLGYDTKYIYSKNYNPYGTSIELTKDQKVRYCTQFLEFTKRVIKLKVLSRQPIFYEITRKNLTRFYWLNETYNLTRIHYTRFYNFEKYPIIFQENIIYTIDNNTKFDEKTYLMEYLSHNIHKMDCILKTFRISDDGNIVRGRKGTYKIADDKIYLIFDTPFTLEGDETIEKYIKFDPYACENIKNET